MQMVGLAINAVRRRRRRTNLAAECGGNFPRGKIRHPVRGDSDEPDARWAYAAEEAEGSTSRRRPRQRTAPAEGRRRSEHDVACDCSRLGSHDSLFSNRTLMRGSHRINILARGPIESQRKFGISWRVGSTLLCVSVRSEVCASVLASHGSESTTADC